jgi:hypothetical protein
MSGTWIVCQGSLLDTTSGGGFEFIGPFASEVEAKAYCIGHPVAPGFLIQAIELLSPPKQVPSDWRPEE